MLGAGLEPARDDPFSASFIPVRRKVRSYLTLGLDYHLAYPNIERTIGNGLGTDCKGFRDGYFRSVRLPNNLYPIHYRDRGAGVGGYDLHIHIALASDGVILFLHVSIGVGKGRWRMWNGVVVSSMESASFGCFPLPF